MNNTETAKAQAFSLVALAMANNPQGYDEQVSVIDDPYAVADQLVALLVLSTPAERRKGLAAELQQYIAQALA